MATHNANDGLIYQVAEVTGPVGFDVRYTFTGVDSFNQVAARFNYTGSATHNVYLQVYNNTSGQWDDLNPTPIHGTSTYGWVSFGISSDTAYIDSGTVQVRFYHSTTGINTHLLQVDFIGLAYTSQGGSNTLHSQLAGRSGADAHPMSAITGLDLRFENLSAAVAASGGGAVGPIEWADITGQIELATPLTDLLLGYIPAEHIDTDNSASAVHHTLGTGEYHAAAGNHGHSDYQTLAKQTTYSSSTQAQINDRLKSSTAASTYKTIAGFNSYSAAAAAAREAHKTADDHPQYHNDTRGDARYVQQAYTSAGGGRATNDEVAATYSRKASVDLRDLGAAFDTRRVRNGAITASSAVFTSMSAAFTAADQNKRIVVHGAGANGKNLYTTIQSVDSATQATLADAASVTITRDESAWGTDDSTAWQTAINMAKRREHINNALTAGEKLAIRCPVGSPSMLVTGLTINQKDDISISGCSIVFGADINAFSLTNARYITIEHNHIDGMMWNAPNSSQVYTNGAAVILNGPDGDGAPWTADDWWGKLRENYIRFNHIERVKHGVASNGTYGGVATHIKENIMQTFHVYGSIGVNPSSSDNYTQNNVIIDFNKGIYTDANNVVSRINNNHIYSAGGYGNLGAVASTTSGSNQITLTSIPDRFAAHIADMEGEYVKVSAGFPSASTYYKVIAATSNTLDLADISGSPVNATSSQTGVTVLSYSMDYNIHIGPNSDRVYVEHNWIDIAQTANILVEASSRWKIKDNNFKKDLWDDAKYIHLNYATPTAITGCELSGNEFWNVGTVATDALTETNVDKDNSTTFYVERTNIYDAYVNAISGYPSQASESGTLPDGVTAPSATHIYDIDTDATGLLGLRIKGDADKSKLDLYTYGAQYTVPAFRGYKAGGTESSPTVTPNNDYLFGLAGWGWNGSAWQQGGALRFITSQQFANNQNGTTFALYLAPTNGTLPTSPTVTVDGAGTVTATTLSDGTTSKTVTELWNNGGGPSLASIAAGGTVSCSHTTVFITSGAAGADTTLPASCTAGKVITVKNSSGAAQDIIAASGYIDDTPGLEWRIPSTGTTSFISEGTTLGWQAVKHPVPNCDNATTSKLLYDVTTNTYTCGTDQTGTATITAADTQVIFADGANTPAGAAGLLWDKASSIATISRTDNDAVAPTLVFKGKRASDGLKSGDTFGQIGVLGYYDNTNADSIFRGAIKIMATQDWTSTNMGFKTVIRSRADNTVTPVIDTITANSNGTVTINAGGSANKVICWKSDGKTLGYCSSAVDSGGGCTCN